MVKINGELFDVAGKTVLEFLEKENYDLRRIAVERNGDIVPKSKYCEAVMASGDVLEIVTFVGGG